MTGRAVDALSVVAAAETVTDRGSPMAQREGSHHSWQECHAKRVSNKRIIN